METAARITAQKVARDSYGRLLAILAARFNDISLAEDVLAQAFVAALEKWPSSGVPRNPQAWLLKTAKNRGIDNLRSSAVRLNQPLDDEIIQTLASIEKRLQDIPDHRLKLLFVCAHHAIDPAIRTPLMLQTVMGIDANVIAIAFNIAPSAMAQRLVRAKQKIKEARILFVVPQINELKARLESVMEAIYGAYAIYYNGADESLGAARENMGEEALYLAELLCTLLPREPEVLGLAALIGYSYSRHFARFCNNCLVPLNEQNMELWDLQLIEFAETKLHQARNLNIIGRFQIEAAIQSVHANRLKTNVTDWAAICLLYEGLAQIAPSIGAKIGQAAAIANIYGPVAGLQIIDGLSADVRENYQPAIVTRAHLLVQIGDRESADKLYRRAIEITPNVAVAAFLKSKISCAK